MKRVADESVHLIVTSPPYWQLKDYGTAGQIGFDDTYEAYVNNLNLVWRECCRVLHKGCRMCVNVGDQFARSVYYGRYKVIPIRAEIIKFCEAMGLDYMGAVIWRKVTTCNTSGGATVMGSFPYPRNGILKLDYEFILVFRKHGRAPSVGKAVKERSRLTHDEWNTYFSGHWTFPGERQQDHPAAFPVELPRRLIRMFSFTGDTVLDPFLGSGTTCFAASELGRNSVGYEMNRDFLPVIRSRLGGGADRLSVNAEIDVAYERAIRQDLKAATAELPYIFKDPFGLDRKTDPRKASFGSRVNGKPADRETYFAVKRVVSPEVILLDNGEMVRLLGVRTLSATKDDAVRFLRESTKGKKIFLRTDTAVAGGEGVPAAYVYLANRTFLNAHLVKRGLVGVDDGPDFKYKAKFFGLAEAARRRRPA
jgi:DNA modification methylase